MGCAIRTSRVRSTRVPRSSAATVATSAAPLYLPRATPSLFRLLSLRSIWTLSLVTYGTVLYQAGVCPRSVLAPYQQAVEECPLSHLCPPCALPPEGRSTPTALEATHLKNRTSG